MSGSLVPRPQRTNPWPLTVEARQRLDAEIARLRDDLTSLTSRGLEEGIVMLAVMVLLFAWSAYSAIHSR